MHRISKVAPPRPRRGRIHAPTVAQQTATAAVRDNFTPAAVGAVVSATLGAAPAIVAFLAQLMGLIWVCIKVYETPTVRAFVARLRRKKKRV